MGLEENKEIVRGLFAPLTTILEQHDELYGPDWVGRFPGMPPLNADGHRQYSQVMLAAFPNLDRTIDDIVAEGDRVVARWSARGVHEGEFMGSPPSGNVVTSSGITIFRIADGRVVEEWAESDMVGLLQQVGLMPGPG